jgi:hypothetical protein
MFSEFLDEYVPNELDIIVDLIKGVDPGSYVSGPCCYLGPLDEGESDGYFSDR